MKNSPQLENDIGIIGGGQLARMLAQAADDLNLGVSCLVESDQDPVTQIKGPHFFTCTTDFAHSIATLCFESEFFDPQKVHACLNKKPQIQVQPSLDSMLILRDKLEQKKLFETLSLPQARFKEIRHSSWEKDLEDTICLFSKGFVLKKALGAYDGKGNLVFKPQSLPHDPKKLDRFCQETFAQSSRLYAEEFVSFSHELALVAVYSHRKSEFMTYPLTLTKQHQGACLQAYGPAVALGVDARYALQASTWALQLAKHLKDLGCFAIEMFLSPEGDLLLNELAPRVHNSGHFTQVEGLASQFHNHIRSITGDSLVPTAHQGFYLMQNLLVPEDFISTHIDSAQALQALELCFRDCQGLHNIEWYAKTQATPLRKMGHINFKFSNKEELEQIRNQSIHSKIDRLWKILSQN
jgi:5-(carboxyamino)imidazole ribonucleotide synthase